MLDATKKRFDPRDASRLPAWFADLHRVTGALYRAGMWQRDDDRPISFFLCRLGEEGHCLAIATLRHDGPDGLILAPREGVEACVEFCKTFEHFGDMFPSPPDSVVLTLERLNAFDPETRGELLEFAPLPGARYPFLDGFPSDPREERDKAYRGIVAILDALGAYQELSAHTRPKVNCAVFVDDDLYGNMSIHPLGAKRSRASRHAVSRPDSGEREYYTFEVTLKYTKPRVWRRFKLPVEGTTFDDLKQAIMDSMNWADCHLWEFSAPGRFPIATRPCEPWEREILFSHEDFDDHTPSADEVELVDYFGTMKRPGEGVCTFEYDFGDSWEHKVARKKIELLPKDSPARIFDKAVGAAPIEDCGGIPGFERLCQIIKTGQDPWGEDVEEIKEWYDLDEIRDFDPEEVAKRFDAATEHGEEGAS